MTPDRRPLPMALSECGLDNRQLAEQLARYRHLSATVLGIERNGPTARIRFSHRVDVDALEQTLAIERGCCSFFTLDYNATARVLAIAADTEHSDALSALLMTLTRSPGLPPERDSA